MLFRSVFVAFAIPKVKLANLTPVQGPGLFPVLAGAAIFVWSWDGFMRMAIMASEVKEPQRNIPFAIVGGIAISAVVFIAVAGVTLGVLGASEMRGPTTDAPLLVAGARTMGRWGLWVVLATAWLDTLTEAWGDLLTVTRVALAMGKGHELPAWLGVVHSRYRSPHHAVIALGLVCIALALFLDLRPVLAVANFFTLVWYGIVASNALMLPKGQRLVWPVVSWFALAGCVALLGSLPAWALATGGAALALLTGVRWVAHRQRSA